MKNCLYMILTKYYSILILLIFTLAFLFVGCNGNHNLQKRVALKWNYGRIIDFSWERKQIDCDTIIDDCELLRTPLLIVSKLDEELCPDCLVRFLEYANEYISGFSSDSLGYVVITKSKRISEIQSCLKDKNIGNVQLIIDVNDSFSKENSFLSVKGWRNAFLVDERRSILMMGDPLTNNRIRQLYDKTIKQIIEEKNGAKKSIDRLAINYNKKY